MGNNLPLSYVSNVGVFRTGLWSEYASTDRYQTPSDPRTWVDAALPNFHEMFGTTTLQPYAEYELEGRAELHASRPASSSRTTSRTSRSSPTTARPSAISTARRPCKHAVDYHTWLPSIDAHYLVQPYWSVYGQYGKGQNIPPTSIFDVKGAQVATTPKPILTDTVQFGSVWKSNRATLDVDFYHINFQNDYSSTTDPVTGETIYFLNGDSTTQGVEAESTILVGGGFAVYLNGTTGSAKYNDTKQWVQNAPSDTETIGLTFNRGSWNLGFFSKRVGKMYNDNGAIHQAVPIDPFNITNLFVNYPLGGSSKLSEHAHPLRGQQPDRQPRDYGRHAGVGKLEPARARRHPDADGGPQRVGVVDPRVLPSIAATRKFKAQSAKLRFAL